MVQGYLQGAYSQIPFHRVGVAALKGHADESQHVEQLGAVVRAVGGHVDERRGFAGCGVGHRVGVARAEIDRGVESGLGGVVSDLEEQRAGVVKH